LVQQIGALLLLRVPVRALQLTIALAMIVIVAFSLTRKDSWAQISIRVLSSRRPVGYLATLRANADAYNTNTYPEVLRTFAQMIEGTPKVQTFEAVTSTSYALVGA
jgi:hypothetical protein